MKIIYGVVILIGVFFITPTVAYLLFTIVTKGATFNF